jgi:hypothetical protein
LTLGRGRKGFAPGRGNRETTADRTENSTETAAGYQPRFGRQSQEAAMVRNLVKTPESIAPRNKAQEKKTSSKSKSRSRSKKQSRTTSVM